MNHISAATHYNTHYPDEHRDLPDTAKEITAGCGVDNQLALAVSNTRNNQDAKCRVMLFTNHPNILIYNRIKTCADV